MQKALVAADHVAIMRSGKGSMAGIKKPVQLHRLKGVGKLEPSGYYQFLPRRASRLNAPAPAAARARKPPATETFFININICI